MEPEPKPFRAIDYVDGHSETARENLRRATDVLHQHIGRCRWCGPRVKKDGAAAKLCSRGEELHQVVRYRQAPSDATPR